MSAPRPGLVRASRVAALLCLAGVLGLVVGWSFEPVRTAVAYLASWVFWLSLALGMLFLVMIHHVTGSTWFIVLRRTAERGFSTLGVLALLFVPLLLGASRLYVWMDPGSLEPAVQEVVARKAAYLNGPFFVGRAALYLAVWWGVAGLLARWSAAQDTRGGERLAVRQKRFSAVALPAVVLTSTFASFDWLMSLSPAWASSVFGVYVFAGSMVGASSLLIVASFLGQRAGRLPGIGVSHYHGMGKLLFTFVVFWAYIAFFQFFIVWIANVPEETVWYLARWRDGWKPVSVLLVLGHFVLPFFLLLSRDLKRRPPHLAAVAGWLIAMHYLDVYWMVKPSSPLPGFDLAWPDAAAMLTVGGATVAWALFAAARGREAARGDPRFARSLRFETR